MTQSQPFIHIVCSEEQTAAFDQLHKCVSERLYEKDPQQGLTVAANVISLNSSNYTAWWLRRRCWETLGNDSTSLINELQGFTRTWLDDSPKSYQGWYHREWLIKRITPPSESLLKDELKDVALHLDEDSKNHCAWQYRQVLVSHFQLPLGPEYEFIEAMILSDCRNNSAWNYRQWLCSLSEPDLQNDIRKRECKYLATWLRRTPTNEALFHYLLGMYQDPISRAPHDLPPLSAMHTSAREAVLALSKEEEPSHFILELAALILMAEGQKDEARKIFQDLANRWDSLHARYYAWLVNNC